MKRVRRKTLPSSPISVPLEGCSENSDLSIDDEVGELKDLKSTKKKGRKSLISSKTPPSRKSEYSVPVEATRSWEKEYTNPLTSPKPLQPREKFDLDQKSGEKKRTSSLSHHFPKKFPSRHEEQEETQICSSRSRSSRSRSPPCTSPSRTSRESKSARPSSSRHSLMFTSPLIRSDPRSSSTPRCTSPLSSQPESVQSPRSSRSRHSVMSPTPFTQSDQSSFPRSPSCTPPHSKTKSVNQSPHFSSRSRHSFMIPSPFTTSDCPSSSSSSPLVALSPRLKSFFSPQGDSPPPFSPSLSFSESDECQFRCDSYLEIVNYLVSLTSEKIEFFFIGFEQSFDIDQFKLLETMKEMMTTKEGEEQQTEKKEQIIQIVLSWRKSLTPFYQTFNPLLSKAIEEFLDSLESTPFGSTLIWKGRMSLSSCGTSHHVAQMLTSMMFQRYKYLRSDEFFDGFWEKKEKYIRSPNIMAMSEIFNRISSMVVESILFCESETRSQNLMFMIKLATKLFKLRNFEGWGAVISGMNQSSIQRLKPLWKHLNSKYKKRFKLFDEMLSPEANFKNYQNLLHSSEPPLLPWFAPKLRELRYLYDGNQAKTEEGYVNLPYLMKIGSSIKSFLQYQQFQYDFPHSPDTALLLKFFQKRSVSEEICYTQSLFVSPRREPGTKASQEQMTEQEEKIV